MYQEKGMYQLKTLINNMPVSLAELIRTAGVDERTLLRMRRGGRVQRTSAAKILKALSKIYEAEYTLDNVAGINWY
jgi:predicted transcriptional regulator